MTILVKNKFIFIHIPKNSGSAMTKAIQKSYRGTKNETFRESRKIWSKYWN